MANWEQILTSGTSIGKLSDVTITSADAGDVLICNGSGVWVDAVISGTSNEIVVSSTAGAINVSQPVDVTIGQDLSVSRNAVVTEDLTVNGGDFILQNPNSAERDTTLTIKSGATAKDAILELWGNNGAAAGDSWQIKGAADNVLTISNDVATDNTYVAMATFTPDGTATDSKLVLAGDLYLGGDLLQFTSNEKITRSSGTLAVTAASTTFSGDITVTGNDITFGNGETISNAVNGTVAITATTTSVSGDLTVTGNDITFGNGETISNASNGVVAITSPSTTFSGDITVTGNDITFGNGESISNATDNVLAITSASTTLSGDLTVTGNDISGSGGSAISIGGVAAGNIDVINNLTVRGNTVYGYISSSPVEMLQFSGTGDVNIKNDLSVDNDLVVDGNLTVSGTTVTLDTQTLLVEDNAIVLNSNATGDAEDGADAGIIVKRGAANVTNKNAALFWDESYTNVDVAADDLGGRWAVGLGTEGGSAPNTTFTAPAIATYGGYVVGITESGGAPASGDLATGLGAMHIKTGSPGQIYIRVA